MPVTLSWSEVALRLALTVLAGLLIGFNREEHGRPAGMRTTLLVTLAASISTIQANLLMNSIGKASNSFVVLDLMRLPLGILSGMGFIGAGAILRRGNLVTGLTTAATLWFATVMGLCFGGGQLGLGIIAALLAFAILWWLKSLEKTLLHSDARATLLMSLTTREPTDKEIRSTIEQSGCEILGWGIQYRNQGVQRDICCELQWHSHSGDKLPPYFVMEMAKTPGISDVRWTPQSVSNEFAAASGPSAASARGE